MYIYMSRFESHTGMLNQIVELGVVAAKYAIHAELASVLGGLWPKGLLSGELTKVCEAEKGRPRMTNELEVQAVCFTLTPPEARRVRSNFQASGREPQLTKLTSPPPNCLQAKISS